VIGITAKATAVGLTPTGRMTPDRVEGCVYRSEAPVETTVKAPVTAVKAPIETAIPPVETAIETAIPAIKAPVEIDPELNVLG
jgi:hypothetical protein